MFEKQKIYGNKWSEISKFLKGRSENSTKNHFYSIVRKNLRRYNKKKPETEKIHRNIQDLLQDSEFCKVLLKKPRHHPKKIQKQQVSSEISQKPKEKVKKNKRGKPKPLNLTENLETFCRPSPYRDSKSVTDFNDKEKNNYFYQDSDVSTEIATCRSTIDLTKNLNVK